MPFWPLHSSSIECLVEFSHLQPLFKSSRRSSLILGSVHLSRFVCLGPPCLSTFTPPNVLSWILEPSNVSFLVTPLLRRVTNVMTFFHRNYMLVWMSHFLSILPTTRFRGSPWVKLVPQTPTLMLRSLSLSLTIHPLLLCPMQNESLTRGRCGKTNRQGDTCLLKET